MSDVLRNDSPQQASCMPFAKLGMPIGMTGNRSPGLVNTAQFEISNPYHSQGIASGGSALLDAINRGKVHLAKFILDAGDDPEIVNTRDFKGKTPLIRACYIKEEITRDKTVQLLLSKGADVNVQDDAGRTALSYACELRVNDVVKILVKNNVDPDIADDKGNTALIYSAKAGNDVAVEMLIRSFRRLGLNVDYINNDGLTALLISAKQGYNACASLLAIEGKACISFRDREKGMNAEEWARSQGCSTPEVMAFSAQAQFAGHKRIDGGSRGGSMRRDDDDRPRLEGASGTSRDLDVDDLAHRLEGLGNDDAEKFFPNKDNNYLNVTNIPERRKRRSLPAIKFSSSIFSGRRSPKEGMRTPKRKTSGSKERGRKSPISPGRQDQRSPVSPSSLSRHSPLGELSGSDIGDERRPGSGSSTVASTGKVNCQVLNAPPAGKGAKPKR